MKKKVFSSNRWNINKNHDWSECKAEREREKKERNMPRKNIARLNTRPYPRRCIVRRLTQLRCANAVNHSNDSISQFLRLWSTLKHRSVCFCACSTCCAYTHMRVCVCVCVCDLSPRKVQAKKRVNWMHEPNGIERVKCSACHIIELFSFLW